MIYNNTIIPIFVSTWFIHLYTTQGCRTKLKLVHYFMLHKHTYSDLVVICPETRTLWKWIFGALFKICIWVNLHSNNNVMMRIWRLYIKTLTSSKHCPSTLTAFEHQTSSNIFSSGTLGLRTSSACWSIQSSLHMKLWSQDSRFICMQ